MKEMFYLTTHSTHFLYGYMASLRKSADDVPADMPQNIPTFDTVRFPMYRQW